MNDERFGKKANSLTVGNEVGAQVGGSIVQAGAVHGDVHLHHTPRAQVVPRQLPAHTPHFVGRTDELYQLAALLDTTAQFGDTVVISAINGTAGIGKTALAVRWARQVADRFPDGQLYVNLRGFDPTGAAVTPAEAVRGFLDAFDVPQERIPISFEAQAALYRSLLAGRRVLVLLDNARDSEQVRPLLPGDPTCLVVVTSRNHLTGLITAEGAYPLTMDVFTTVEAFELLVRRLGKVRVEAEPQVVNEIVALCARLPLALSIVAARAATHPNFPLSALASELRADHGGLDAFDGDDVATNVRAVFSWSYHRLSVEAARLFRLLGLHPGPDIATSAAASLACLPPDAVRPLLAELAKAHMLTERLPGRFAFHDLLRAHATELTNSVDDPVERRAAVARTLDHYLHTAHDAVRLLHARREPVTPGPPISGVTPQTLVNLSEAWAWFDAEYPVLLAAVRLATASGHDSYAWQLACMLDEFFDRGGHYHDWYVMQRTVLAAARRTGDLRGQAHAHRSLGRACLWLDDCDDACTNLRQALRLFDELGDQTGQAQTHFDLGWVFEHKDHYEKALAHDRQGLALSRATGSRVGEARGLNSIGWFHTLLGEHERALASCQQALVLFRELDDSRGVAHTLDSIGYALHYLGHHESARTYYLQSLALRRELGERYGQATVLAHLGDTYLAVGDLAAAREVWRQSLDILDHLGPVLRASLGYPDADEVRAKLRHLDSVDEQLQHRRPDGSGIVPDHG